MTKNNAAWSLMEVVRSNLALAAASYKVAGDVESCSIFAATTLFQTGMEQAQVLGLPEEQVMDMLLDTVEKQLGSTSSAFDAFMQEVGLW